jgi:hypothetical protein
VKLIQGHRMCRCFLGHSASFLNRFLLEFGHIWLNGLEIMKHEILKEL